MVTGSPGPVPDFQRFPRTTPGYVRPLETHGGCSRLAPNVRERISVKPRPTALRREWRKAPPCWIGGAAARSALDGPARDPEFGKSPCDVAAVGRGVHHLVHVQDASIAPNVERQPDGERRPVTDHAIGLGHAFGGIAQKGVVRPNRFREPAVCRWRIDARRKMGNIEVANEFAALTERLADSRSTAGPGLGEPGQDDRLLAAVVREPIGPAVGTRQREVWRHVSNRQATWSGNDGGALIRLRCRHDGQGGKRRNQDGSHQVSRERSRQPACDCAL